MKKMIKIILSVIGISLGLTTGILYFYNIEMLNKLLQNPIVETLLLFLLFALIIIAAVEISIFSTRQDERFRRIRNKAAFDTLIHFFGCLISIPWLAQFAGWQSMPLSIGSACFYAGILLGSIYCISFTYRYFRMS